MVKGDPGASPWYPTAFSTVHRAWPCLAFSIPSELGLVEAALGGIYCSRTWARQPSSRPDADPLLSSNQNMSSLFFRKLKAGDILTDLFTAARILLCPAACQSPPNRGEKSSSHLPQPYLSRCCHLPYFKHTHTHTFKNRLTMKLVKPGSQGP